MSVLWLFYVLFFARILNPCSKKSPQSQLKSKRGPSIGENPLECSGHWRLSRGFFLCFCCLFCFCFLGYTKTTRIYVIFYT